MAALRSTPHVAVDAPQWLLEETVHANPSANGDPGPWTPSGHPPSAEVLRLVRDGDWEPGHQRATLLRCARALMEAGTPLDDVVDRLWGALERSTWTAEPWRREQVESLVCDFTQHRPPALSGRRRYTRTDDGNANRFADR